MSEFSVSEPLSGMAGTIRRAVDSEQFDLAGYTEARVKELMVASFSSPLDQPVEMVKFTFIVGGGKLVRSRYSDDLLKCKKAVLEINSLLLLFFRDGSCTKRY